MPTLLFLYHCTGHWGWWWASFKMRMLQTAPVLPRYSTHPLRPLHWQVYMHNKKTKEDFECQAFNMHYNISTCIVITLDGEAPCLLCNATVANYKNTVWVSTYRLNISTYFQSFHVVHSFPSKECHFLLESWLSHVWLQQPNKHVKRWQT